MFASSDTFYARCCQPFYYFIFFFLSATSRCLPPLILPRPLFIDGRLLPAAMIRDGYAVAAYCQIFATLLMRFSFCQRLRLRLITPLHADAATLMPCRFRRDTSLRHGCLFLRHFLPRLIRCQRHAALFRL